MAEKQRNHRKHRYFNYIDRQKTKIDSILRITYALNRDVNKIVGKTEESNAIEGLDKDIKLDIISNTLLEIRDKLENYSKAQPNNNQILQNPNIQHMNQMPYNSYPFIPRIMF